MHVAQILLFPLACGSILLSNKKNWPINSSHSIQKLDWRPVSGFETLYEVSEDGNVLSLRNGKILKPSIDKEGYYTHGLHNGKNNQKRLHRILAEAFLPNPENHPLIDHIDRNRLNSSLSNLRWVSHKGNRDNSEYTRARKDSSSGHKNVLKQKNGKYQVVIKRQYIGQYDTLEEAINARNTFFAK